MFNTLASLLMWCQIRNEYRISTPAHETEVKYSIINVLGFMKIGINAQSVTHRITAKSNIYILIQKGGR